jgi:NAD(P)-dependent dehydrogenase (short-subunit alcohol dehydrogenase family)
LGKEAIDRMSADMAIELADKKVTVLSIWVGAVKTELIDELVLKPQGVSFYGKSLKELKIVNFF